ncbi:hypothetical protein Hanom_Chr01g00081271 [Helianthus anomalus]
MTQPPREELGKLTRCVQITNSKLGSLIEADAMDIVGGCLVASEWSLRGYLLMEPLRILPMRR